jgi:cellulose synthase/poly-beta-1,6-N-acetylglucosamine synthase-like glycosyltransferase
MDLDVVVCAKNRAEQLEQILRQIVHEVPFKDLIVIYGSSKDGTQQVAEKYTKRVFWDGDEGLGAARSLGIRKAASEFVAMIDTDVILPKDWYKHLMRHFESSKVAAAMGTTLYGYGWSPVQRYFEYSLSRMHEWWGCTNTVFKRDVLLEIGNFDERIRGAGEDYDLFRRILSAGYRWVWDREVVVYHPMSFSEYLQHTRWWAKGTPIIRELAVQARASSLLRVYCGRAYSLLISFKEGVRLSFALHPTMFFFVPLFKFVWVTAELNELKKA